MAAKQEIIIIDSDDELDGEDPEISFVGSSDEVMEISEIPPPKAKAPFRTAQEKVTTRPTARVMTLNLPDYSYGVASSSRPQRTQEQANNNGQLPTPDRSPPRLPPQSPQSLRIEASLNNGPISGRNDSSGSKKRSYGLDEASSTIGESNPRKRPRNVRKRR